jgi:hypothetical protein
MFCCKNFWVQKGIIAQCLWTPASALYCFFVGLNSCKACFPSFLNEPYYIHPVNCKLQASIIFLGDQFLLSSCQSHFKTAILLTAVSYLPVGSAIGQPYAAFPLGFIGIDILKKIKLEVAPMAVQQQERIEARFLMIKHVKSVDCCKHFLKELTSNANIFQVTAETRYAFAPKHDFWASRHCFAIFFHSHYFCLQSTRQRDQSLIPILASYFLLRR